MAAVGAWPVPWTPYGLHGGVAGPLGLVWPPWGRGFSPGSRIGVVGAWPLFYASYAFREGVAHPLAPYCRRGGVAGPLGHVWPPRRRVRYPRPRMAAMRVRPVPWAPYRRRGGVAPPWVSYCRRGSVATLLGFVWLPWGRGRSLGPRMAAVGAWPVPWNPYGRRGGVAGPWAPYGCSGGVGGPFGPEWPKWGCGRPWALYGRRGGVAGPLALVWLPCASGRSPGPCIDAVGSWPVPWACMVTMEAWPVAWVPNLRRGEWPVPWAMYGQRGYVAGLLGPVWPPWKRGRSFGPRMDVVEAWPVPWAPYGRCEGLAVPLGPVRRP